jgi:3-oxoacyl-[acyl-carrier protein] reductase
VTQPRQRVAIITGAGSEYGIGFAAARLLGAEGMRVVLTSTTDRIFDRVDELRASGVEAEGVVADLRQQSGVDAVVARAEGAYGSVDVLINNAGMTSVSDSDAPGGIDRLSTHLWHASLERNLTTSFLMIRAVVEGMRSAGYGRIVNVSSVSGPVAAYTGDVAYHAAKAGVVGLTRAVAIETASFGITVNAVAPGWIDTASASDYERAMGAATPVGRSGTPEEVAHAIAFLAGDGASYITGQLITVDGANSVSEERGR